VFPGVELDEVPGRQRRATPPTGELPLAADNIALEADERPRPGPHDPVLAVDNAPQLGGVEYLAGERRVRRDRLDTVDRVRERQFGVLEVGEQGHTHLDRLRGIACPCRARRVALLALFVVRGPGDSGVCAVGGPTGVGEFVESALITLVCHTGDFGSPPQRVCRRGSDSPHMHPATRQQAVAVAGLLCVGALATLAVSPAGVLAELEALADTPVVLATVLAAVYLVRPFLLWPMSLVAVVLGYLYGPAVALPVALAGAALTATPPYLLGRYARTDMGLFGTVSSSGAQLVGAVGETRGVLAARLSPVPGDPISYGAGMAGVSARPFYVGSLLGEVPWAVVAVLTGASMRSLSPAEFAVSPELVVVLAGLALLTLSGPLYSHTRGSQAR
jgi:uncharacterized membrane protein YdjX (TVP38/TMEM64 family)